MKISLRLPIVLLALAASLSSRAAEISISDSSLTPDGSNAAQQLQTDISIPNGGNVLPNTNGTVIYHVTTFTFGANSDAHFVSRFNATGGQNRLGVQVQDNGLVEFVSSGDSGRTRVNLSRDMAGETITLLIKQHYDSSHDSLRATLGTSDDTLMTVWVNPDNTDVEGSGITAGDMHTLWNSNTYKFFTQTIENQSTPGTAGASFITGTRILTGTNATFANALAIATGGTPPTGIVDAGTSTVSSSPMAVPADGITGSSVTVNLKDAGGNPVAGKEVSLSGNGSAVITTGNNTSDANGEVIFTVKSSSVGPETFTATDVTDSSLVIAQTASVDFQMVVPIGPVDAGNSTLVASTASLSANGIDTSIITVTLMDSNGALIAGEGVTLGGSPAGTSISPVGAQFTDPNGEVAFAVSSTQIGTVTFTATSSTDNTTITQTVEVEFVDPATATAYNVKFLDEGQANATGLVGVAGSPGEIWNQGIMSANALIDATGVTTSGVNVSGLGNDGRTIPSAALSVFNGGRGFFGKGQDTTMSITGLSPDTAYDLYIYALGHNTGAWGNIADTERTAGDFVTTNTVNGNGQSQWLDNGKAGTNGNSFLINGNYVVFQSIVADASGKISVLVDAYDGIDGISGNGDGDCRLYVNGLQIRPAGGMSVDYAAWRAAQYPAIGLPDDDDDGDGLSNEYEHIFGLNPIDPSSSRPYPTTLDNGSGTFSYTRRTRSLINMNYKVWYSTDLQQWFEDNAANQLPVSVTNDVETMGVEIDPALLSEPKLFLQVRATPITRLDVEPALVNLWGSGHTITLLFSEPMNASSASYPANYTVTQDGVGALSVTGATLNPGGGSVTLTLGSSLGNNTGYTVNIDRVTSSTGQSLGSGVSRQFRTWDNNPNGIKVFILAGQSNMVGFGEVENGATGPGTIGSLRFLAANNGSYPEYDYTSLLTNPADTGSAFKTRADVKIWYRDGGNGNLGGAILKGELGPPFKGRDSGKIGPEFAFGQVLGDYYAANNVLIIKCSWGGRDLAEKFRSPGAVANRGGQVGDFYNAIIEYSRQVLYNLDTEFPEWSGKGYEIVGFGWHQGYNDRISTAFSNYYKYNLPDLISDVRDVYNKPNLPFVIASTGMATGAAEAAPYPGYSKVERAQLWVDSMAEPSLPPPPAQPANVLSTDTRPFWRESGVSPSDQGFHWNWNAETYFLIGKAMGDDMVRLLNP